MNCNDSDAVETFAQPGPLKDRAFVEIPCPTSWEKMTGNDSVRFCSQCSLNVYNIANMTDKEAEAVFAKGIDGDRLCARLYRRPDGTIMTDNCPRALRKIRNASRWLKTKIVACFGLLLSLAAPAQADNQEKNSSKSGAPSSKCAPIDAPQSKDKSNKDKSPPEKSNNNNNNQPMHTMGAIRVPMPAEQAELGKIAAPNKVAQPTTQKTPNSPSADKPPVTPPDKQGGEPITHKMGRVRVGPAKVNPTKVDPTVKPATPTKDEKAK